MSDFLSPLLQWLNANPEFAGLVTFIISASESIAVIGTIVPGSITMTALGALAGAGVIPLWETILWAILGAIVGDGISYGLGRYFKSRIKVAWPFRNYPGLLESGETFVHKYGSMSVFIGRFVGPVRALVPLVAGMLGMKPLQFVIANVISAIGWAPAYMLPGILLGAASLELPPDIAIHVMLVLVLITLFVILCLWIIYKMIKLFHNQIDQMQNWIWLKMKNNRTLVPITHLIKHHDAKKSHGQLNLAFYILMTSLLFVFLVFLVKTYGPSHIFVNDALFHFFRGIRTYQLDTIFINITLLGQKEVLLPIVLIIFIFFLSTKNVQTALHILALGILVVASVFILKKLIQSPRPWGIAINHETFSMPSGHTSLATTIIMGLTFFIATTLRPASRWIVYSLGFLLVFLVGVSRLYLGAHWFTDVVSAWLLGAIIVMLVVISYNRVKEAVINPVSFIAVTLIAFVMMVGLFHHFYFDTARINYTQLSWPKETIVMKNWWSNNQGLPAYRVSLFGFPSQNINIVWAGDVKKIKQTLIKQGWENPPARDWISTLHRIADVKSTQYLSMVSPQYLDKKPALIMTKRAQGIKSLLVLRLWDSDRMLHKSDTTLWVGTVGAIPRSYSWLYKSHPGEMQINPVYIFSLQVNNTWQWKIIQMKKNIKRNTQQDIMLIREKT